MLNLVEMDKRLASHKQASEPLNQHILLIGLFDIDPNDNDAFKVAWAEDVAFLRKQPSYT